ncbi:MAG TPA: amidohydrolase family protein [Gemmatimonadales bacterium]|nr:amidohydrolase family protein [Gemmatimonadales bacterium]
MRIDVNSFLGQYPFRRVTGGSPRDLLAAMDRVGIDQALVSNLAAMFWKDPTEGNAVLYQWAGQEPRFRPVPAVHPELPNWESVLLEAQDRGAPCVRADPACYGLDPEGSEMRALVAACGSAGIPLLLSVRLEDGRQRHPNDRAPELAPAAVRALIRSTGRIRLIVTHADRDFIEQVHFGSTPSEANRILWDICWIWGPPEDHLALLLQTIGVSRFTFGTGMPLRIPEASVAKLDLADLGPDQRRKVEAENLAAFLA